MSHIFIHTGRALISSGGAMVTSVVLLFVGLGGLLVVLLAYIYRKQFKNLYSIRRGMLLVFAQFHKIFPMLVRNTITIFWVCICLMLLLVFNNEHIQDRGRLLLALPSDVAGVFHSVENFVQPVAILLGSMGTMANQDFCLAPGWPATFSDLKMI